MKIKSFVGLISILSLFPFALSSFSAEEETKLIEKALVETLSTQEQKEALQKYLTNLSKKKRNEAIHLRELASSEPKHHSSQARKKKLVELAAQLDKEASIHEETLKTLRQSLVQ
ncbi:LIC10421/LIC12816 family protein [Leptospira licerasiae]|uniref:Uncharacterized protein n=1 Tax=Leptospira licerasiae str. MMD4847 TaxID=1049971 RepID=A0ABP2RD33_9LEPT|nr:hypothetical protein [Leptospira licerasiae]EIE00658.1 hypothetical protein LEP1GSC185_0313 [Leptospira licerasiae serovar Varillal str. VAR 010]EJZ40769.1 hypothetical protein LEP1GSC178_1829 [Leptospira licerasiae str. MMD4847]